MTDTLDRRVTGVLAALLLVLPLFLGGRASFAVAVADVVVLGLAALTLRERRRRADVGDAPGLGWLAAFAALAFATTLPVPPALLHALAPASADLVATVLPGWPDGPTWSRWRPLALDAWAVRDEVARLAIGLGTFAVLVAWPWRDGVAGRQRAARTLVVALLAGGVGMALLGLATHVLGNGQVLWLTDEVAQEGRASGPFVNPNHFATWLEAVIPLGLALLAVTALRAVAGVRRAARSARALGVRPRQAWAQALIAQQQRLLVPLAVLAGLVVALAAHTASGSRGGTAALLAGLGVTAAGLLAGMVRGPRWVRRALPIVAACGLLVASVGTLALWDASLADDGVEATAGADPGLASRLEVMAAGGALVRDHWRVGTGLGTWLHAFRPYQAPPVDGGIWDRAHDDYLELAAETGVVGLVLVLGFVLALALAARRTAAPAADDGFRAPGFEAPGFEVSDWRRALDAIGPLRWGLVGGVFALAVHASVDFGLRLPGNLVVAAVVAGLLVLTAQPRVGRAGGGVALAILIVALAGTLLPRAVDGVGALAGFAPRDPRAAIAAADLRWAEEEDAEGALALVRSALDRAPADREVHEVHATVLDGGPESEAALRRALVLDPWSIELRDRLALALWARGDAVAAAAELEESVRRAPALVSHGYLAEDVQDETGEGATRVLRVLAEGDGLAVRLGALPAPLADAVTRGLSRARDATPPGAERLAVVDDLATVYEARGAPADAAAALFAAADGLVDGGPRLARAARGYLAAGDVAGAEAALLAAVVRTPERGELYRQLAVEVYAARGDFDTAAQVLEAAERHAADLTPVWRATTEVLTRREAAWSARFAGEAATPPPDAAASDPPRTADDRLAEVLR